MEMPEDLEEIKTMSEVAREAASELLASMKGTESVDEKVAIAHAISSLLSAY